MKLKLLHYTPNLSTEISEEDFRKLEQLTRGFPAARRNLEIAIDGGQSLRSLLADAAKLCGSDFRPRGWM